MTFFLRKILDRRRWLRSASEGDRRQDPYAGGGLRDAGDRQTDSGQGDRQAETYASSAEDRKVAALHQPVVEPLLLTTVQVSTLQGDILLTRASGFFFRRAGALFLVTSRHVLFDADSGHRPDAIEINVHTAPDNLALSSLVRLPLYSGGVGLWRQGRDRGGDVDVAVLEIQRSLLPATAVLQAFDEEHLLSSLALADVGVPVLMIGFPLGFHDTLHHLPVARHAIIASSFGLRFQGQGCFLTDGRAHRGSSGAPVVVRAGAPDSAFPWKLLGVHSSRFDMGSRDIGQDESLGLNCAWYADILRTMTA